MTTKNEKNKYINSLIDNMCEIQAYRQIEIFPNKLSETLYVVSDIIGNPNSYNEEQIKYYNNIILKYIDEYKQI